MNKPEKKRCCEKWNKFSTKHNCTFVYCPECGKCYLDWGKLPSEEELAYFILNFYETECLDDAMNISKLAKAIYKRIRGEKS